MCNSYLCAHERSIFFQTYTQLVACRRRRGSRIVCLIVVISSVFLAGRRARDRSRRERKRSVRKKGLFIRRLAIKRGGTETGVVCLAIDEKSTEGRCNQYVYLLSARPTFLNLNLNLNSLTRLQQSTSAKCR